MKTRFASLLIILSMCLSFCSCGTEAKTLTDFNPTLNSWIFGDETVAETGEGLYFYYGSYLFYLDYSSMKANVLCFNPECLHYDEPDPFRIQDCDAHFNGSGGDGVCLGEAGGKLYVLYNRLPETKKSLISMDLDGSNRVTIIKDCADIDSLTMRMHRGVFYYAKKVTNEDKSRSWVIASINTSDTNPEENILFTVPGEQGYVDNILPYGESVYFSCGYTDEDGPHSTLEIYNIKKKNVTEISDCGEISGAVGDYIVYRQDGTFMYYNTKSGQISEENNGLNAFAESHPGWQCHADVVLTDCAILSCFDKDGADDFVTDMIIIDQEGNECARIPEQSWNQKFHIVSDVAGLRYLFMGNKSNDADCVYAYKIDDLKAGIVDPVSVLSPDENRNLMPGVSYYTE